MRYNAATTQFRDLPIHIDEVALTKSVCEESLWQFTRTFWDEIIPEPMVPNFHMEFLCDELQTLAERVFAGEPKEYDLIVNIPPGTSKSTICSVIFPAWTYTRMPHARHICGSHTNDLVLNLSRMSRNIVRSPLYQACWPHITLSDDQDAKGYWVTEQKGFRFSCTVAGKTPTGFHGHFLSVDDPIDPQKAISKAELKAANEWMSNTLFNRKVDKLVSVTVLIMQRLHQNDPTGYLLKEAEKGGTSIRHIRLPCDDTFDISPKYLKKFYKANGGLLDPKRLPRSVMKEFRTKGEYSYAGQYGQTPIPLGGGMFRTARIHVGKYPPPAADFKRRVRYWDKAGTEDGGAYTAGVLMGIDRWDRIWVLDVVRGQWEAFERETIIQQTARLDGIGVDIAIEQEPGSGGKESAQATVGRLIGFHIIVDVPKGDKMQRADPYSYQTNAGNVHLAPGQWNSAYLEELTFFGRRGTYKDQVDSSSGAFAQLSQPLLIAGAL